MPWTVPDKGEVLHEHQSILFQEMLDVLVEGVQGLTCVLHGCAVSAQGTPDMTVAVAAGVVRSAGVYRAVTAGNVTIGAADATNPRFDLVVVNTSGTKAVRAGTAAANPKPPARTAGDVVLAIVYVPAADTAIAANQIVDQRVMRDGADIGHIWGLTMSNNATDLANDIDVAVGEAVDEDGGHLMVLAAAITKRIDALFAEGTNQGGLNTGAVANATWYEVHLIKRDDTGAVDVMFTTTANRATLPANFTRARRIGWIRRGTNTNLAFVQDGDYFTLTTQVNDVAASVTATATLVALTAPPNSLARFRAALVTGGGGTNLQDQTIVFSDPDEGNVTPAVATGIASLTIGEPATGILQGTAGHFEVRVNGSSQIEHDSSANAVTGTCTFDISTYGWVDRRRRIANL